MTVADFLAQNPTVAASTDSAVALRAGFQNRWQGYQDVIERLAKLEDGHTKLKDDHTKVKDDHTKLKDDHTKLKDDHTKLKDDHTKLKESLARTSRLIARLEDVAERAEMVWQIMDADQQFLIALKHTHLPLLNYATASFLLETYRKDHNNTVPKGATTVQDFKAAILGLRAKNIILKETVQLFESWWQTDAALEQRTRTAYPVDEDLLDQITSNLAHAKAIPTANRTPSQAAEIERIVTSLRNLRTAIASASTTEVWQEMGGELSYWEEVKSKNGAPSDDTSEGDGKPEKTGKQKKRAKSKAKAKAKAKASRNAEGLGSGSGSRSAGGSKIAGGRKRSK